MRLASLSFAFCLAAASAFAANKPAKPAAPKVVKAKPAPKAKAPAKGKVSARVPAQTWRNRQMAPTKDRYMEIQQALHDRGYLASEPTGKWDAESVDALKRFQTDQSLSVTGRISSLSLINLGLGPAHPEVAQVPVPTTGQN
jgi:peptidoglycan hydrolase-like protein with peptidoglycan-binding domain